MRVQIGVVFILSLVLNSSLLFAQQYGLNGSITDNENNPVGVAVVEVLLPDSTYITHCVADTLGHYSVQTEQEQVIIRVSHLSYKTFTKSIDLARTNQFFIVLEKDEQFISSARVIGQVSSTSYIDGNLVVNPAGIPGMHTMTTSGLIKKLPGVEYGKNQPLTFFGASADVYIDGVKQRMNASALYTYLTSLPAEAISEVKLMTNPPAKYGNGPVIEIILNKGLQDGTVLDASLFAEYYNKMLGDIGSSVFFMNKKGRFSSNTVLGYYNSNGFSESSDSICFEKRIIRDYYFKKGRANTINLSSSLSIDFENNHRLDVGLSAYYSKGNYQTDMSLMPSFSSNEDETIWSKTTDDLYTTTIKYSSPQDKPFQVIANYSGLYGGIRSKNNYEFYGSEIRFDSDIAMVGQMHSLKVDLRNSLFDERLIVEYGGEAELNVIHDKAVYNSRTDIDSSPDFFGREFVPKGYLGLTYNLGHFVFSGRGLVEHTDYLIRNSSSSENRLDFTDFTPRLQVSYQNGIYYGLLMYTKLLQRPNYQDILPGVRYTNDYYYTVGNPSLLPIKGHGFVFLNNIGRVMMRFDFAVAKDLYGSLMTVNKGAIYERQSVVGDLRLYTFYTSIPYRFFDGAITGSISGNFSLRELMNLSDAVAALASPGKLYYEGSVKWTGEWEINDQLVLEGLTTYTLPSLSLLYRTWPRIAIGTSVSYTFPHRPFSIRIDAENVFDSNDKRFELYSPEAYKFSKTHLRGPVVRLSLQYNFLKGRDLHGDYLDLKPDTDRIVQSK